jgi:hypothetical protein
MWLIDWLASRVSSPSPPRPYSQIKAEIERREAPNIARATRTEESLLSLLAEAGLDDLRHRLEQRRDDH